MLSDSSPNIRDLTSVGGADPAAFRKLVSQSLSSASDGVARDSRLYPPLSGAFKSSLVSLTTTSSTLFDQCQLDMFLSFSVDFLATALNSLPTRDTRFDTYTIRRPIVI